MKTLKLIPILATFAVAAFAKDAVAPATAPTPAPAATLKVDDLQTQVNTLNQIVNALAQQRNQARQERDNLEVQLAVAQQTIRDLTAQIETLKKGPK